MTSDPEARAGLQRIYAALEADVAAAGPVCQASGRCCRFQDYGHTLFLSQLEAELLLEEGLPAGAALDRSSCPFQQGKLCTARERRPLGCRVFFCDPSYQERAGELSEKYIGELKRLCERLGRDWEYGPLFDVLSRNAGA